MFIILLMMVSVAALNIVSTLMMTVTDKESDIAILRALGMRPSSIMTIFIIQGAFIGPVWYHHRGQCRGRPSRSERVRHTPLARAVIQYGLPAE